jgi:hypothetical protein
MRCRKAGNSGMTGQRLVETRDRCRHRGERSKRGAISGNPVA